MRRWLACLLLAVLVTGPAWSEQVYVRNKPFKGTVSGKGPATAVDLQSLVAALGYTLTEVGGNWVVTGPGEAAALPEGASGSGQLYYQGKVVGTAAEGGATLVPLISTAQGLGAVAKHNKDMGSIDVYLPTGPVAASPGGTSSGAPTFSSGGYKMVYFWASW